jgi:hypothetical protein
VASRFQHRAEMAFVPLLGLVLLLAAIALANPDLVAWGALLVIPFLLLFPAPTAALYLLSFALGYVALRRLGMIAGVVAGLAVVVGIGMLVPTFWNAHVGSQEKALTALDRPLERALAKLGLVTIIDHGANKQADCGPLCFTLLYSGAATEVTIKNGAQDPNGVTWTRIRQPDPCHTTKQANWRHGYRLTPATSSGMPWSATVSSKSARLRRVLAGSLSSIALGRIASPATGSSFHRCSAAGRRYASRCREIGRNSRRARPIWSRAGFLWFCGCPSTALPTAVLTGTGRTRPGRTVAERPIFQPSSTLPRCACQRRRRRRFGRPRTAGSPTLGMRIARPAKRSAGR